MPMNRGALAASTALGLSLLAAPVAAYAQVTYDFNLPAQPLTDSLRTVGSRAFVNVAFDPAAVRGKIAPGLHGTYSAQDALALLTAGSGLRVRATSGRSFLVEFAAIPIAFTGSAPSPTQAPSDVAPQSAVEEIIVTAQRRAETAQDVPISITALSAKQMARAGIQTTQDIALKTPGLTMTQTRNGVVPYIRGIGSVSSTAEGAVALYVDNVYISSSRGAIFTLNNIDRVEVLKGPQGTLFGRSATGGLIHVVTREPSFTPELNGSIGYGNYNTLSGNLYATGGLTDKVAMDFAFAASHQGDGWGHNLLLGTDLNIRRDWAARSKLRFDASPDTKVIVAADYSAWKSDVGSTRQALQGTRAFGGVVAPPSIYDINSDLPAITASADGFGKDPKSWQGGVSMNIDHSFSKAVNLTSVTAWRKGVARAYLDGDTGPQRVVAAFTEEPTQTFQQDVILNGTTGRLTWTSGLNYFHYKTGFTPQEIGSVVPRQNTALFAYDYGKSYAAFGQGTYDFRQGTRLTLGLRYTRDQSHVVGHLEATPGNSLPPGTIIASTDQSPSKRTHAKWDAVTWRVALDHDVADNAMVYASYSKGYKPGTFSISTPPLPTNLSPVGDAVNPEKLYAYEMGVKSEFFDRQFRANAAIFYYDYKDMQLATLTTAGTQSYYYNAPQAKVYGGELELNYNPHIRTGNLQISAAATLLDPRYRDLRRVPTYRPNPNAPFGNLLVNCNTAPAACDATGHRMVRASKISSTMGLDYSVPVTDALDAAVNINWTHVGKFYFEPDNRLAQQPYDWVNGQISLGRHDDRWRARVWARNMTGAKYYVSLQSSALADTASPGAPRTYGVTIDFKY